MKIETTINNEKYLIDLDKAKELGIIERVKEFRPIMVKDIPNGSIFRWKFCPVGDLKEYLMLDNTKFSKGQCVEINGKCKGRTSWFENYCSLEYYDYSTKTWVTQIEK